MSCGSLTAREVTWLGLGLGLGLGLEDEAGLLRHMRRGRAPPALEKRELAAQVG